MKFTPEEMAYELPADTSDWVPVGRGPAAIFAKPSDARSARLDPDVGRFFADDRLVNEVLRRAMLLLELGGGLTAAPPPRKKRKTA